MIPLIFFIDAHHIFEILKLKFLKLLRILTIVLTLLIINIVGQLSLLYVPDFIPLELTGR